VHQFGHCSFGNINLEPFPHHRLKIDTAPAHHAVHSGIRPGGDDLCQGSLLLCRQQRGAPGAGAVNKTLKTFGIITANPIA